VGLKSPEEARPLRIAMMLESDGPGGAEIVLMQLSEELARRGHTVVPVGPENRSGWLAGELRQRGFEPEVFHLRSPFDWGCVTGLRKLFRDHQIDVVHSHEFTMAIYGAIAARLERTRHVITFHGSQTMHQALRRRIAVRWAMRNSAATVAISAATRAQLDRDLGLRPGVLGVVLNGVPERAGDGERIRRELGVRPGEIVLLAVGNLDPRKAHIVLLEALHGLGSEGMTAPWRLVIAGGRGGTEKLKLEEFARRHGFADRVHILLQRNDVPDLQAAADIFVMPSLWEGLPLAVLEAMLAGNPVVASRVSGIPEAVGEGEEGLLVPPGEVPALANALRKLIESPDLRREMGERASRRGRAQFTVGAMADNYLRLYRGTAA
jgi:glycosyltransferase involved in cell wall biosynthesis